MSGGSSAEENWLDDDNNKKDELDGDDDLESGSNSNIGFPVNRNKEMLRHKKV